MNNPITITNTHTGTKAAFAPCDPGAVTMYVCGPTVYDRAHIGNARSAVVFDLVFRLLRHTYGEAAVSYARNFTDIDDKIINRAQTSGGDIHAAIADLTETTIQWYHDDMDALGVLRPTYEPRATDFVSEMILDIESMIRKNGAYASTDGHVFFSAVKNPHKGFLSGRTDLNDDAMRRIEPHTSKIHPADFVLWKPSTPEQPGWDSPWGRGRPGWHIECYAMSTRLLGESFDIHGGGSDLTFPHHDNEVAQAKCCSPDQDYARTWMHNGMITVEGQKMSKSLGNFTTVSDLRISMPGGAIRLGLLTTHYRSSLDWSSSLVDRTIRSWERFAKLARSSVREVSVPEDIIDALSDDLNTAEVIATLHQFLCDGNADGMAASLRFLGVSIKDDRSAHSRDIEGHIDLVLTRRVKARAEKDFALSDRLRDDLAAAGVQIEDRPEGTTWKASHQVDDSKLLSIDPS